MLVLAVYGIVECIISVESSVVVLRSPPKRCAHYSLFMIVGVCLGGQHASEFICVVWCKYVQVSIVDIRVYCSICHDATFVDVPYVCTISLAM